VHNVRLPGAVAPAVLAVIAAGCGGAGQSIPDSSSRTPNRGVPNPFRVIARYSTSSLGLNRPANLAIGPDGNLYVTDGCQRVAVISPYGKVLRRWGRAGRGPGEFHFVSHDPSAPGVSAGIAVGADGRVYVDDSGNSRLEVFTSVGRFMRQCGRYGSDSGEILFTNPSPWTGAETSTWPTTKPKL
jgi:hypothetical protein